MPMKPRGAYLWAQIGARVDLSAMTLTQNRVTRKLRARARGVLYPGGRHFHLCKRCQAGDDPVEVREPDRVERERSGRYSQGSVEAILQRWLG
jgi:hypothetical protein